MRKKIYRVESIIMSGVLGLLGFSCSDINGETPDMYGTPITDYVVKGTITDENQKPIKGIQVINSYDFTYAPNVIKDTTYTNEKGQFEGKMKGYNSLSKVKTEFNDIDGDQNGGSFSNEVQNNTNSDFVQTKENKGWFNGEFTLTLKQILKKKQ